MRTIIYSFVFVQLFVAVSSTITVDITCADDVVLYADGTYIGSHNDKTTAKQLQIPSNTKVVSVRCQVDSTKSASGGILASFRMEKDGDYITDATWQCTNTYSSGWTSASYSNASWPYAYTLGNNSDGSDHGRAAGLNKVSGIAAHGKWIWTPNYQSKYGDIIVYCRGRIGLDETHDNYGRKFVLGFMDNIDWVADHNKSASSYPPRKNKLLLTTPKPSGVTVYIYTPLISSGSSGYVNEAHTITTGTVTILELPSELEHEAKHIVQNKVLIVIATADIRVVGENTEIYSTDLFLSMPITSLGTESEAIEYFGMCWDWGKDCRILMAANYDNTVLNIKPTDYLVYGGKNYSAGQNIQIQLNKYQSFQLVSSTSIGLTGVQINSNHPIAVYAGNRKAYVTNTVDGSSSDHLAEQLMPVKMWGKEFIITPLPYGAEGNGVTRSAKYLALYAYMASEDNTQITTKYYNPSSGSYLGQVAKTLNKGQVYKFAKGKGSVGVMTANKAIQVAQFATIATIAEQCIGDPWMQIIPPIYEFGRDYTLLTPNLTALSGCSPIHYFTVIVKDADKSGIMVNKVKVDATKYQTIPGTGLVFQTVTIGFGEHRIQHGNTSVSYSVYTFGYGAFDSYALMAGTRMAPINQACTVTSSTPGDNLDNDCDGSIDEDTCSGNEPTKDCAPYQPVDGGWSPWSVAGPCTCPSGSSSGTEPHKRTCTKPVPMYNGWQCDTSVEGYTKEVNCICTPVNGSWTEWTSYGACSATCGSGKQIRTRSCTDPFPANGGNDCPGDRMEEQNCNSGACPTTTTTTTTTTTISSTTQSSSSVSTSGSTPTQSTTSGTTTTQSSTSGSNPTQSGTTLSNPTQSSTSGSNPTQSSTSGSNPTQSSTSGSNPTQSSTSGTNPTQSSTSGSNPTQSSTSGSNPTQSSTSGSNPTQSSTSGTNPTQSSTSVSNPTQSSTSGSNPTQSSNSGSNPTQSSTSGSNPTQSSTSGSNPTQSSTSGSNPTQSSTSGSNPTQSSTSGSNPTQSSTSGSNPTQSSTSGSNPTQPSTSGSNPTQSSTSGSNPTQSSTSGSNPTQSSTSGSNPTQSSSTASNSAGSSSTTTTTSNTNAAASSTTTSSTGSTASNSAAGSSTTSTTTSTTPLPIEGNLQAQEQVTQSGGGSNNAAIGAGAGAALAALGAAVGAGILYKRLKPGNKIAAGKKRDGDDEEKDPEDAIGNANLSDMPNTMAPANHALTSHF